MKKGTGTEAFVEIETASFLKALFEELKEKASEKKLATELILEKTLPSRLQGDESFIRQSFSTLFTHCVQVTDRETIIFAIRGMDMEEGGFALRLSVLEGGNGFTEEQLELLTDKKDHCQEAYLSELFAMRRAAEVRKGGFSVYSVFGGGALYYMILPCEIVEHTSIGELEKKEFGLHNMDFPGEKAGEEKPGTKWIDRDVALNYAGGMEEMRLEMLSIYYEQAQQYLKELPELFLSEDWEMYRIVVHAIKGNSLGIGAEGFSKEAYEQEMAAKNGDIEKIKAEFKTFYEHYQSLVEEVGKSKI